MSADPTMHPELLMPAGPIEAEHRAFQARKVLAVTRIGLGWIFLWAFLDKTFGLGLNTASGDAWINGGSPTYGYLTVGTQDKLLHDLFAGLSGSAADWLFMLGLLGVGVALVLGIALRIAAASGGLMLVLMWAASLPLEHNPAVDDHLIHALVLAALAIFGAGHTWGLGDRWEQLRLVKRYPILK